MKRVSLLIFGFIILVLLFTGCSMKQAISNKNENSVSNKKQDSSDLSGKDELLFDTLSLKKQLTNRGYSPEIDTNASKGFLSVKPIVFNYKGEQFGVHEYRNSTEMEKEARRINKDGTNIKGTEIDYIATPHFYKKGKIIIMYVGENKDLLNIFKQIMGEQFAGDMR